MMRRTWMAVVTIAGALAGVGCRNTEPAPAPAPEPNPPPRPPAPADRPPVPPWTQPGPVCNSPFAIVETDRATCEPTLGNGLWKLFPRRAPKNQAAPVKGDKDYVKPPEPTDPRRGSAKSRPFCVYELTTKEKPPTPSQFAEIHATQECAIAVGMGGPYPAVDGPVFSRNFDRQVIAMAEAEPGKPAADLLKTDERRAPVVAVLDASPYGVTKRDVSGHGRTMSRIIGHVSCVGGADSPHCKDFVKPYVALPLIQTAGNWVAGPDGGFIGYFHDLFDAFDEALRERPRDGHLIMNLSLGWDPATTDPNGPEARNMRTLLEEAYCLGVLVVGAAGNGTTAAQAPVLPAALESAGGPDDKRKLPDVKWCQEEFGIADPKPPKRGYRPLIHAVGAVDLYDERLPTMRAWADPRVSAYGMAASIEGPKAGEFSDAFNGTSPATAAVAAIAARVWRLKPGFDAAEVMAAVYKGGYLLETKNQASRTELCLDTGRDRCHSWPARRVTVCGALNAALGSAKLHCVTPLHPDRHDPATAGKYFPPRPSDPLTPPSINSPCGITNCGIPIGAPPAHGAALVGPMGVATCATCILFTNGGNGMLTGSMNFNGTPPSWFYTTVIITDWNFVPHYYYPFQFASPVGWFWQGLPAGSTNDVFGAEIDWTYYAAGLWWTDAASLQIAP
jgi:hypothetical protein